ncbi:MAG: sn-glycerol-3-phosphate ABC transporter permease UgpE [Alphaproteobacteria bacterium]
MIENRPWLRLAAHGLLILGVLVVASPVWLAFVAASHDAAILGRALAPFWFGEIFVEKFSFVLSVGIKEAGSPPVFGMMLNSLVMALGVAVGKIVISFLSAFAIVFFRFPGRMLCFWLIFVTLMLPVEVRIIPTFAVVANLGLLNSYGGLIVPLIASATATFLFRQFFLTVPDEMVEAARIDGASPMRFMWDILLPLSRTNIAALFVILFIFGWNQYLWPLLITTDESMYTVVMGIQRMTVVADAYPLWHLVMATAIVAMAPPVLVVLGMQRLFVKGLVETEK